MYPCQVGYKNIISRGKSQCLSEAEEVPRAKPEILPKLNKSADLFQGINAYRIKLTCNNQQEQTQEWEQTRNTAQQGE